MNQLKKLPLTNWKYKDLKRFHFLINDTPHSFSQEILQVSIYLKTLQIRIVYVKDYLLREKILLQKNKIDNI